MIIDGTNAVLGRLGARVAKLALLGNNIDIVNSEKIIVTGKKSVVLEYYDLKNKLGVTVKGPFYPVDPKMFVKRIYRGMLPYKNDRGRAALARIKCYNGVPAEFAGKQFEKLGQKDLKVNFVTIGEICKFIGGKR